ncbi:GSCOCG00011434001-RA-CDS [Cotesia congregata]|nr:GSCOCG00011434001-RA-CDS [Cotesia congregata]
MRNCRQPTPSQTQILRQQFLNPWQYQFRLFSKLERRLHHHQSKAPHGRTISPWSKLPSVEQWASHRIHDQSKIYQ